jgi:ribonuclease HI
LAPWILYFDGSRTDKLSGAGITLENPDGVRFAYSFQLEWHCTNNQAEYEAVIIGLEILLEMGVHEVEVLGDSLLVINQLKGTYKCLSFTLVPFLNRALELLDQFNEVSLEHIPRECNHAANELAQLATGISFADGVRERILKVERRTLPSFMARKEYNDEWFVATLDAIDVDWRQPIVDYLDDPQAPVDRQTRFRALNYVLKGGELLRRGEDGMDFRCIFGLEAKRIMREVHLGVCGSHQAGPKMRWLIRRYGYYWPTILKDCISFAKGCLDCQAHGPVHHVPAIPMQPIIKPWPARGWALDLIGLIHPHSSAHHKFIIVATDFFTKWVEAEALTEASAPTVRRFIFRNIVCRFGIPECLVADRGAAFMAAEVNELMTDFGIQFLHSTPYYAQSNGQAEASNKVIITILKKMLADNPRDWHSELDSTLWAYRTSKRSPTGTTPYALMFGHDAVLPLEINVRSLRVQEQHQLLGEDYVQAMWQEHEDLSELRLAALDSLILEKRRVSRVYDKRTRGLSFGEGELVWKAILPLGEKVRERGKWSPRWEGPYIIDKILGKGAYHLRYADGELHPNPINGRFLKKYYPSVWEFDDPPPPSSGQGGTT